ncbi:hypothetical protein OG439_07940 [Amycolatopsis sp. NBC_01307]|uniref:hypothetical protein n=1 Tax=Amycolatopsis sp. NBC_01307 TaxID=2903561 RepID=UPI002E0DC966|nr:hypothetical protein OG439_07940 [Amycolatopsis sp. NBC_01307]
MSEMSGVGGVFDWLPAEITTQQLVTLSLGRNRNVPAVLGQLNPTDPAGAIVYNLFARWVAVKFSQLAADVDHDWDDYEHAVVWLAANPRYGSGRSAVPDRLAGLLRQLSEWYDEKFLDDLDGVLRAAKTDRKGFEGKKFQAGVHQRASAQDLSLREMAARIDESHQELTTTIGTLRQAVGAFQPADGFPGKDRLFELTDRAYTALLTARARLKAAAAKEDPGDEGGAFGAPAKAVLSEARNYAQQYENTVVALKNLFDELDKWISSRTDAYVDKNFETLYPQTRGIVLTIKTAAAGLGVVSGILAATGAALPVATAVGVLAGVTGGVGFTLDKVNRWARKRSGRGDSATRVSALTEARGKTDEELAVSVAEAGEAPLTVGEIGGTVLEKGASLLNRVTHSGAVSAAGHIAAGVAHATGGITSALAVGATILDWRSYAAAQDLSLHQVVSSAQAQRAEQLVRMVADAVQARKNGVRLENAEVLAIARSGITLKAENGVELFIDENGGFRRLETLDLIGAKVRERHMTIGTGQLTYILDWDRSVWNEPTDDDHVAEVKVPATRSGDGVDVDLVLGVTSEAELTPRSISAGKTVSLRDLRKAFLEQVEEDYLEGVSRGSLEYSVVTGACYAWDTDSGQVVDLPPDAKPIRKGRWFCYPMAAVASTSILEPEKGKLAYIRGWAWKNVNTGEVTVQYAEPPVLFPDGAPELITGEVDEADEVPAEFTLPSVATIFEVLLADFEERHSGGLPATGGSDDRFVLRSREFTACGVWDGVDKNAVEHLRGDEIPTYDEASGTWTLYYALPVVGVASAVPGNALGCFTLDERDGTSDWNLDVDMPVVLDAGFTVRIHTDQPLDAHMIEEYLG